MVKDRTNILTSNPIGAKSAEGKKHTSMFMVTINPNKRFHDLNTPEARAMTLKLKGLSNFLLKKKNIRAGLKFIDKPDPATKIVVPVDREIHMGKIISFSEDRTGAVEWGSKDHKLHIHVQFDIEHRTFLQLDRAFYLDMASTILGIPAKSIHLHFNGSTRQPGYKQYVQKNAHEDTPSKFVAHKTEFHSWEPVADEESSE